MRGSDGIRGCDGIRGSDGMRGSDGIRGCDGTDGEWGRGEERRRKDAGDRRIADEVPRSAQEVRDGHPRSDQSVDMVGTRGRAAF